MTSSSIMDVILLVLFCTIILLRLSQHIKLSASIPNSNQTNPSHNPKPTTQDPPAVVHQSSSEPKCFRVSNIPAGWTKDNLRCWLERLDERLDFNNADCRVSLYLACYGRGQTALLNMKCIPECFRNIDPGESKHFNVSNKLGCPGKEIVLSVDYHFYDLTPLNTPDMRPEHIVTEFVHLCRVTGVTTDAVATVSSQ
ncbi:hypothetical protein BDD12DRAFT_898072 [Trichophaea hybrida]|nr:hypothetical protein BDD12DRAFT_898072 [Trichophaea hybrida]